MMMTKTVRMMIRNVVTMIVTMLLLTPLSIRMKTEKRTVTTVKKVMMMRVIKITQIKTSNNKNKNCNIDIEGSICDI